MVDTMAYQSHTLYGRLMISLIAIPPVLIILSSLLLGKTFGGRFPSRWWLIRLGVIPLICLGFACYVLATPAPIPDNYDPVAHGNQGRLDFIAVMMWGLALPTIFVAVAFPTSLAYALLKRRAGSPVEDRASRKCLLCAHPLSVDDDPMSGDAGGDCWGCIGKIEADLGWEPSVASVQKEIGQGLRFRDGTPKPAPSN